MSQHTQYFSIPFANVSNVPKTPTYTVWFAAWSTEWPIVEPGMNPPFVVGATTDTLPAGAVLLGLSDKDPIPPPLPPAPSTLSSSDYQTSVSEWLELSRDA